MQLRCFVAGVLCCCWSTASLGAPVVVYDNTTTLQNVFTTIGTTGLDTQKGDTISLSGSERYITRTDVIVTGGSYGAVADLQLKLFMNDGAEGGPDTLLWSSEFIEDIALNYDLKTVSFAVPSVLVPDTFTWTLESRNVEETSVYIAWYNPPKVGTSEAFTWSYEYSNWEKFLDFDDHGANYGVTVWAIPEPSAASLLRACVIMTGLSWWRLSRGS